jgi:hypothetical protein
MRARPRKVCHAQNATCVRIRHRRVADFDKKFVSAMSNFPSNTSTCSGTVTVAGAAPIVAGSCTGSYRGISGNFNLTFTLAEVAAKANCSASSAFLRQSIVIAGSGTVSFR